MRPSIYLGFSPQPSGPQPVRPSPSLCGLVVCPSFHGRPPQKATLNPLGDPTGRISAWSKSQMGWCEPLIETPYLPAEGGFVPPRGHALFVVRSLLLPSSSTIGLPGYSGARGTQSHANRPIDSRPIRPVTVRAESVEVPTRRLSLPGNARRRESGGPSQAGAVPGVARQAAQPRLLVGEGDLTLLGEAVCLQMPDESRDGGSQPVLAQ